MFNLELNSIKLMKLNSHSYWIIHFLQENHHCPQVRDQQLWICVSAALLSEVQCRLCGDQMLRHEHGGLHWTPLHLPDYSERYHWPHVNFLQIHAFDNLLFQRMLGPLWQSAIPIIKPSHHSQLSVLCWRRPSLISLSFSLR